MYSKFQLGIKYFKHYFSSSNGKGHGVHSPFIFDFITKVLNDGQAYPDYEKIEELRRQLLKDERVLNVEDLGAGSSSADSSKRSVASIAKNAAKPKKYGQLLYRIAKHYPASRILDLGTSLGITTAYLASGNSKAKLITVEGSKEIAEAAKENFKKLKLENVELMRGDFKYTMPMGLKKLAEVDLAFIDGNHRKDATLDYFSQLQKHIHSNSIIIFDDIHWSSEMEVAWEAIKTNPSVKCTIDLFFIGIVLFRKEFKEKQDFKIRF